MKEFVQNKKMFELLLLYVHLNVNCMFCGT